MKTPLIWMALMLSVSTATLAQTLDRVRETGKFTIGYRTDAAPFAYKNEIGEPAGYAVDLCRFVAAETRRTLGVDSLEVVYVPVTAENRFDMIETGQIDILCGPTSVTLQRRARVDFSLYTFVDGASVLYGADGPDNFEDLRGRRVGVRAGTTTEKTLRATLERLDIEAEVVAVDDHRAGRNAVESGVLAAYFADRGLLQYLALTSERPESLRLSDRYFTIEPYALALTRGDSDFRLAVDRTLGTLYRTGEIDNVFANAFGPDAEPSELLGAIFTVNSLRD